ncbi:MAG: DEAD/DEAH box helicase [Hormoscilla sp. GUM202]|nr:DEAD/DEAH box helicase [Hormoscilla sp. GUM202]
MTESQPPDYAAIIRAAKSATPTEKPDFIAPGKTVHSPHYGAGKVIGILGNRLIVKFPGYSIPVQFKDWQQAVQSGEVVPETTEEKNFTQSETGIAFELIQAINKPEYRAIASQFSSSIADITIITASPGKRYQIPEYLPPALVQGLQQVGITSLYGHQLEALEQLRSGKDLSITTPTASGKTLCYNLAILESCLKQLHNCALYIFPLKALAFDQLRKLQRLVATFPLSDRLKVGQMTGDTSRGDRKKLFLPNPPHILAVSPDLLHYQLEKVRRRGEWQPWREFLRRLHWVVIDESHTYIGAFGAHFANLMRRLRRAVDEVGGNSEKLQFICSSATIGNPAEMARRFSGRTHQPERLHLIERSDATASTQTILSFAPSDTANPDACKIIISLLQQNLRGLVFCNSRGAVKNLLSLIQRETARQGLGYLAQQAGIFYGSLKGDRRRNLIRQLETGSLKVIISTSALEAGIDLPELDFCLLRGYPGSIMSFRQRLGRVGRKHPGLIIFLPVAQNALDNYYGKNPQQLLEGEVESAVFNPDYPTILSKHLECCGAESGLPFQDIESRFGEKAGAIASALLEQEKLSMSARDYLQTYGYPHKNVNIRGNNSLSVDLVNAETGEEFENMSLDIAYREVFPKAIYTASDDGKSLLTYECEKLDIEKGKAYLKPLSEPPNMFTQAENDLKVKRLSKLEETKIINTALTEGRLRLRLYWGEITSLVTGYDVLSREYRLTCTNKRCPKYHWPQESKSCSACGRKLHYAEINEVKEKIQFEKPYGTTYQAPLLKVEINPGLLKALSQEVLRLKKTVREQHQDTIPNGLEYLWISTPGWLALHSIGHLLSFALPLVVLSSSLDVNYLVQKEGDRPTVVGYFFDTCDGGNGAAEAIFQHFSRLAAKAMSLAAACDCQFGCPRCLTQSGCPQQNEGLHKEIGLFLLEAISPVED